MLAAFAGRVGLPVLIATGNADQAQAAIALGHQHRAVRQEGERPGMVEAGGDPAIAKKLELVRADDALILSQELPVALSVRGVAPEVMGIGPIEAIPDALRKAGLQKSDLEWIELNEAFAAQALAVMRTCELDPARVNPLGGAIALGHPLGATGAIKVATLLHGLRREKMKYGMVSMCIGHGMGAAGIFEAL